MSAHSEDGELPDSEGELSPSDDEQSSSAQTQNQPKETHKSYTLFNTSSRLQNSQIIDSQNDVDYGIQDADMDPYSDYKPNQTKTTNPKPNQPKSPKDIRDGSSTEEAVSSPGVFGRKNENQKKSRNKRPKPSDDFLSELDQYNRIKDGAGAPKRSRRDRVHIKDKNSYHDFDNPSGGRRNSNRNHGSDFSDDSSDEEESKFTYRTNNADDSDSDLENNDEKRSRPRIVDGRKSKSSPARKRNRNERNSKIKFEDKRTKNRKNDHGPRGKGGTNDKDESRNMKKQEVCKYYLAQTCLKADRCHYLHQQYPCKNFHFSKSCFRGDKCIFSHEPPNAATGKILDRLRADHWVPDDSKEIAALEENQIILVPKPPPGVPLLKTPPPSLLCEPMTGKYLDFSGPRELMPLGGDPFPDFMHYEPDLTEQIRYECDDKINDVIKSLPIAADSDVEDEADIQVGVPFDEEDADPEEVGWIHLEWRNKIEPLPLLNKKDIPVDQSNPWEANDEVSTNQKQSELDPRRNDQWDESKNERRVSELDPRLRQPDPENERFSDRYGFNGPVKGSPGPGEHDRYGERSSYEYGRERSRGGDRRDNRDRDDRFDNGPYDDGLNRYDHEPDRNRGDRGESDHYGLSDRRYDSYNASPRGNNRDSQQRDQYPSNNSHSPRDQYSGNSSPHRNERDHYGFNTRYENRSRERTPPGTYGSPIGDRDSRPNEQSHDPWSHSDPSDQRLRDPRDDPRSNSNDPRSRKPGWEDRRAEDDRYGYSKSYNDERQPYESYPPADGRFYESDHQQSTNDANNFKPESYNPSKYESYAHQSSNSDYARNSYSRDNDYDQPPESSSEARSYEPENSKPIILRRESVSSNDPKTETAIIPDLQCLECRDPRSRNIQVSDNFPVPDLIDCVDFRVTFTLNGHPVTRSDESLIDYDDKLKLPDLPSIPLPKLSVLTEVTDPRDPRRRISSSNNAPVTPNQNAVLSPSGVKKKISLSDYKQKKEPKPDNVPTSIPVYGSYGSSEM